MTVHLIGCCCDLPAKAIVQNFIQFNGMYGCSFCEQCGITITTIKGGNVRSFPYDHHQPKGPKRTKKDQKGHKRCAWIMQERC